MKSRFLFVAALMLAVAAPLAAQTNEVALWVTNVSMGSTEIDDDPEFPVDLEFDDTIGYGVSFDHAWTDSFSTDFGVTSWGSDAAVSIEDFGDLDLGSLDVMAFTAIGRLHFVRTSMISPYLGAGVAYLDADDFEIVDPEFGDTTSVPVDSEVTWVANAGLNLNFTPRIGAALDAKYIAYEPTSGETAEDELDLELNPLMISAGVRFRF